MLAGDHFVIECGGGAGVGLAEERDPEAVLVDFRNELITLQFAKDVYKVAIDADKMQINQAETARLRAK